MANIEADDKPTATASVKGRSSVEVPERAARRRFTAEYKQQILSAAQNATGRGELGALLRREGLYSSHLTKWRQEEQRGKVAGLTPKRRGPKPKSVDLRDQVIADLKRTLARLELRAERAEAIVELQKKISQLLGISQPQEPESK